MNDYPQGRVHPGATNQNPLPTPPGSWERATLEKLAFATLREQRINRRWRALTRLLWLLFFIIVAWAVLRDEKPNKGSMHTPGATHTAVIAIKGEIADGAEASSEFVVPALRKAFEDDSAKAVVLLVNSPGGSPVQAGIINDEIFRLKRKHKKPIYAVVEESCTSAAYYIAVATDKIYADKASIVGSIGVLMDGFGFTEVMKKVGVERRLMTAGENKGFLDPFSNSTPKQKEFAQTMLNQIHNQFIAAVKVGRGDRLKESPETFSGLFWSGQQAVDMGLIDQLASVSYVAREVVKAEELVDYTRKDNVAERLAKRFGAALGEGAVRTMQYKPEVR